MFVLHLQVLEVIMNDDLVYFRDHWWPCSACRQDGRPHQKWDAQSQAVGHQVCFLWWVFCLCRATEALLLYTLHQEPGNNKPVHRSDLRPSLFFCPFSPPFCFLVQSAELKGFKSTACKWQSQVCTLWSVSVLWALTGPSACDLCVCYWNGSKGEIRLRHLERSFTQISGKFCKTLQYFTSVYFRVLSSVITFC